MRRDAYTIHGGAWDLDDADARAAFRDVIHPDYRYGSVGFRAVEEHGICAVRGGAWDRLAAVARAVYRGLIHPDDRYLNVGFRVVEEVKE